MSLQCVLGLFKVCENLSNSSLVNFVVRLGVVIDPLVDSALLDPSMSHPDVPVVEHGERKPRLFVRGE